MALEDMEIGQLRYIARTKGWEISECGTVAQMVNFIRDIEAFKRQAPEVKREYRKVERAKQKKKTKSKGKKRK